MSKFVCSVYDKNGNLLHDGFYCADTKQNNINNGSKFYDKVGVLKIGMFLKDSMIAVNMRKRMLEMLQEEGDNYGKN